jgi:hypothetical protein
MTLYCGAALRRVLGVATAVAALLAVPNLASADETYSLAGVLRVPGNPVVAFDISWIDPTLQNEYFLADRTNKQVDVVPIVASPPVFTIKPTGANAFAGAPAIIPNCHPGAGANDCVGPNGIITFFNKTSNQIELWVGDGPTTNSACVAGQPFCSTVKVFAGSDAHLVTLINTGGRARADELCVDPVDQIVLIANDAEATDAGVPNPFVSFIGANYKVLGNIVFTEATNGIEQCQWRAADGNFYLNIPEVNGNADDKSPGEVVVISPKTMKVLNRFPVDITVCAGNQGMALGPDPQILLGCNAPAIPSGALNGQIISAVDGSPIETLADQGGNDQVWFEPGSGHYFMAQGQNFPAQMGVIDSAPITIDQDVFIGFAGSTTRRNHSVAAWSGNINGPLTVAFLPIPQVGGTSPTAPAAWSTIVCHPIELQGCIAVFSTNSIGDE